jgi:hypothetical protein
MEGDSVRYYSLELVTVCRSSLEGVVVTGENKKIKGANKVA